MSIIYVQSLYFAYRRENVIELLIWCFPPEIKQNKLKKNLHVIIKTSQ